MTLVPELPFVVVGSYEPYVTGLQITENSELKQVFQHPAHLTSVRTLSAHGRYMATGSTDEHIKIIDLRKLKETVDLYEHEMDISCVRFAGKETLISSDISGVVVIWRTNDWSVLHSMRHDHPVVDFTLHPSHRLLMTLTSNWELCIWDLIKGRLALKRKLDKEELFEEIKIAKRPEPTAIAFDPSGSYYAVHLRHKVLIYSASGEGEIVDQVELPAKSNCFTWFGRHLLIGLNDGRVVDMDLDTFTQMRGRVKSFSQVGNYISICSSTGQIQVFASDEDGIDFVCEGEVESRPICCCIHVLE
ncbi:hypothetical protein PCE1_000613 [Barthelona sp. PCE]